MTEAETQAQILLAVGSRPDMRIFRNTVGEGWVGRVVHRDATTITLANPRAVTFGLAPGSYDLIGLRSIIILPEHVGRQVAQFAAFEVKTLDGDPTTGQQKFGAMVAGFGGLAGVVRSPADAIALADSFPVGVEHNRNINAAL